MLTIPDFKKSGYSKSPAGMESSWAFCLLQKRIDDNEGRTRYFINVYPCTRTISMTFTIKLAMYRGDDYFRISIQPNNKHSIADLEGMCFQFWYQTDMDLDPYNQ